MNYTINYKGNSGFVRPEYTYLYHIQDQFVMVMTQMKLKDNGKPSSKYELVGSTLENEQEPCYWESLELVHRYLSDRDKNNELVEGDYE